MVERALRMADVEIEQAFEAGNGPRGSQCTGKQRRGSDSLRHHHAGIGRARVSEASNVESNAQGVPVVMITSENGEPMLRRRSPWAPAAIFESLYAASGTGADPARACTEGLREGLSGTFVLKLPDSRPI